MVMVKNWGELKVLAFGLDLPHTELAVSWENENLKAHGKLWTWWSPYVDAAIFKGSIEEREALIAADPKTFVMHRHYAKFGHILVAGGRIDRDWAKARLLSTWRSMAPSRVLKAYDLAQR